MVSYFVIFIINLVKDKVVHIAGVTTAYEGSSSAKPVACGTVQVLDHSVSYESHSQPTSLLLLPGENISH